MQDSFGHIVHTIQLLPIEQKEELKFLLEKYLIEEKRNSILTSYNDSLVESKKKKLKFSGKISSLKKML
ncbi:MAG: hypothetical protein C4539_12850 [Ignavibacteriales bacterium]|nr:MAG: hypothetical protein C4539_12850 [Ignavibacteriales bacterium]